jgi:hypothetical protein
MFSIRFTGEYLNKLEFKDIQIRTINKNNNSNEITPYVSIRELINQIDQERVLTELRQLTGAEPMCTKQGCNTITGRETGSEGSNGQKTMSVKRSPP